MNKYHARRTYVEAIGRSFASKREADAALALWARQQAGEIRDLDFQVRYPLTVAPRTSVGSTVPATSVGVYVADFVYSEFCPDWDSLGEEWVRVVADAKGYATPVYRLKKKLMKAIHGIEIKEI